VLITRLVRQRPCAARNDLQRIIGQWPLQCFCLIPRRAHPDVAFLIGRKDDRHRLGMYRLDDRVRRRRQETVDEVRAGDRLGLGAAVSAPALTPAVKSR
jgi:hypothetical protein